MKYRSVKFHWNWNSFRIIFNLTLNRNRNDFEIFYIYIRIETKIYATDLSIWISIEIESNFEVALRSNLSKDWNKMEKCLVSTEFLSFSFFFPFLSLHFFLPKENVCEKCIIYRVFYLFPSYFFSRVISDLDMFSVPSSCRLARTLSWEFNYF